VLGVNLRTHISGCFPGVRGKTALRGPLRESADVRSEGIMIFLVAREGWTDGGRTTLTMVQAELLP
jgi:hypothetical protein